jgi:TM2 domain-containing membrane protein YozV
MLLHGFLLRFLTKIQAVGCRNILIIGILFFFSKTGLAGHSIKASTTAPVPVFESANSLGIVLNEWRIDENKRPSPLLQLWRAKQKKNKKVIAALLAFPFPFGIVGLHRIYLGCAPYVPVAYIGSLGGVFGVLPFIDFCVLLLDKDIDRYINNKKIFMWVN